MDIVGIFELIDEKDPRALDFLVTVTNINYQDKNGNTMLHRAAMSENHEVLDYLITVIKTKFKSIQNLKR